MCHRRRHRGGTSRSTVEGSFAGTCPLRLVRPPARRLLPASRARRGRAARRRPPPRTPAPRRPARSSSATRTAHAARAAARRARRGCSSCATSARPAPHCARAATSATRRPTSSPTRRAPFLPNDPGRGAPGGWQALQWNFAGPAGVNAPDAWDHLIAAGRPGGKGVDDRRARHRRRLRATAAASAARPTSRGTRFVRGYDFVDDDPYPNDHNGHGTHVAGDDRRGAPTTASALTGLAYGATHHAGPGARRRRRGRRADDRRAASASPPTTARKVINLSLEFTADVTRRQIPELLDAIAYARRKGALVVGASGNEAAHRASPTRPRDGNVLSVGATTEHGCLSDYSNAGHGPRPRRPRRRRRRRPARRPELPPAGPAGRDIFQMTLVGDRTARRSASRAATTARRWPRRTSRRPPRWSSPAASSAPHPTPDADRAPPGDDRARPRRARLRHALRLRA